jgi:CheY-like chemotaxis protein
LRAHATALTRIASPRLLTICSNEDKRRAMQSGFQLHLAKPIDSARLAAVVGMLADWTPLGTAAEPGPP